MKIAKKKKTLETYLLHYANYKHVVHVLHIINNNKNSKILFHRYLFQNCPFEYKKVYFFIMQEKISMLDSCLGCPGDTCPVLSR
jgi:citrate lyase synthetase